MFSIIDKTYIFGFSRKKPFKKHITFIWLSFLVLSYSGFCDQNFDLHEKSED